MSSRKPTVASKTLARILLETLDPSLLARNFFGHLHDVYQLDAALLLERCHPNQPQGPDPVHAAGIAERSWSPDFFLIPHLDPNSLFDKLACPGENPVTFEVFPPDRGSRRQVAAFLIEDAPSACRSLALVVARRSPAPLTPGLVKAIREAGKLFALALQNCELYQSTRSCLETIAGEAADRGNELERQRALTEKIIDSLPLGLYVVDRNYEVVAWNRNRELGPFGIKRSDAVGKGIFDVLRRSPRSRIQAELDHVFESGAIDRIETSTEIEGETRHFQVTKIPMRLDDGEVTHVIALSEDITDRQRMFERAANHEKLAAIGQLAAGVVHEINNPLATIAACAESLSTRIEQSPDLAGDSTPEFAEYLKLIESESYRCKGITNSLLDFSRAQVAAKEPVDLNRAIQQTLFLMKHHKRFKAMNLSVELGGEMLPVMANEGQIKQAIMAMLINAVDAMNDGGRLTVWSGVVAGRDPCAAIEISDTGCGVSKESLSKIFDPFFTSKPRGTGTGLGLSVSYGIITEHGGRILVDSKEGEGTHFKILLPIIKEAVREACLQ